MHYGEVTKSRESWARSLLDEFKSNVELLKSAGAVGEQQGPAPVHGSPQHGKRPTRPWTSSVVCTRKSNIPVGFLSSSVP